MSQLAIVYHSAHGHTEFIARQVHAGATQIDGIDVHLIKAEDIARTPDRLVGYDGFIFGSPTYLGGVSAPFKVGSSRVDLQACKLEYSIVSPK